MAYVHDSENMSLGCPQSGKPPSFGKGVLEFYSQRGAADFVRRIYNESGQPTAKLKEFYQRGRSILAGASPELGD